MTRTTAAGLAGVLTLALGACGGSASGDRTSVASDGSPTPARASTEWGAASPDPTTSASSGAAHGGTPSSGPSGPEATAGSPDESEGRHPSNEQAVPAPRALTERNAGTHVSLEEGTTVEVVLDADTGWEVGSDDDAILVVPMQSFTEDDARWEIRAQQPGHAVLTAHGDGRTLTWEITVP